MDLIKLEKQVKLIPLFCCIGILALRGSIRDKSGDLMTIWVSILISIIVLSLLFRIHLEKKNGTFVLKNYYLLLLFLVLSVAMFVYNLVTIPA